MREGHSFLKVRSVVFKEHSLLSVHGRAEVENEANNEVSYSFVTVAGNVTDGDASFSADIESLVIEASA